MREGTVLTRGGRSNAGSRTMEGFRIVLRSLPVCLYSLPVLRRSLPITCL